MDNELVRITVQKIINDPHPEKALEDLNSFFPHAFFSFHVAAGLIVWWPHHDLIQQPIPHAISHMASTIYFFDQHHLHIIKDRTGMTFTTPMEVAIRQAILS